MDLRLEALDELGDRVERRLVLEAMGRHSNLILLDGEGRIMDCLRRVGGRGFPPAAGAAWPGFPPRPPRVISRSHAARRRPAPGAGQPGPGGRGTCCCWTFFTGCRP